jgi:hypothetical protein
LRKLGIAQKVRLRERVTKKQGIAAGGVLALAIAFFAGGYFVADDSSRVSALEGEVASLQGDLDETEVSLSLSESEAQDLGDELDSANDQLHAERSLNGKIPVTQEAAQEYDTDYPWNAAGTVGYLAIKPTDLSQEGSKWILTVEAKNEASEPKTPFCGDGGAALGDTSGNTYTGDSVISSNLDSCEELQPGLTGSYAVEFKLPDGATPAIAAIYGDYEQEEEAKTWELP